MALFAIFLCLLTVKPLHSGQTDAPFPTQKRQQRNFVSEPFTRWTQDQGPMGNLRNMESGMIDFIKSFRDDESGAVTVDWVVLTAAVVGMSVLTYAALADNTASVTDATGATVLTAQEFLTN